MTFDPFGDYATAGYLRNKAGLPYGPKLKRLEHFAFVRQRFTAAENLRQEPELTYRAMRHAHAILFHRVYPWAGLDRQQTLPDKDIYKGSTVRFEHPANIEAAAEEAFRAARQGEGMVARPGYVIGMLAFAHPFLDGNGRTILLVANELATRAGFSIDWRATNKNDYLTALTQEIDDPRNGALDWYLKEFIRPPVSHDDATEALGMVAGLGPRTGTGGEE